MPVVDASIVVDWVAPHSDPRGAASSLLSAWSRAATPVLGPRLLREEVGNALLTGIRRGRWTGAEADVSFDLLRTLPLRVVDVPSDVDRAWELSRRYDQHPLYDMVYVAVAERLQEQLVTADEQLRRRLRSLGLVVGPG